MRAGRPFESRSTVPLAAIQRSLLALEQQGGERLFGEPALDLEDLLQTDGQGKGVLNVLAADELVRAPRLYATFLLWMLSELFERLPEVGDPEKPRLVFFFDEAHLLFDEASKAFLDQVQQVVRLVRSKGVGVFFVTQSPKDIPPEVLGQLGHRVQHALRAFTPDDDKALKAAVARGDIEYVFSENVTNADYERVMRGYAEKGHTLIVGESFAVEAAARKVVALASRLASRGIPVKGVRLDSGDLAALSRSVRRILDDGGLADATIFASGNIDEYRMHDLVAGGAPIDGFGVGTSLVTSSDAPYLDAVYKLQEYAGKARRKRSTGKATWPGRKQVYRHYDRAGRFEHDAVTVEGDEQPGEPLLVPVMRRGRRLGAPESLVAIRERAAGQLAKLPERIRALEPAASPYRVEISPALRKLADQVDRAGEEVPALFR